MSIQIPDHTTVITVDTSTTAKTIQLPQISTFNGRVITVLDHSHHAKTNNITIVSSSGDVIHDNVTTSVLINNDAGSITFIAIAPNKWRVIAYWNGIF